MFVYATSSYPTYTSPALYPHSRYIVSPSISTARERYMWAVADAQAARAQYVSDLEEQHILARLRQQEALRQAEFRQRQLLAVQNDMARRRAGRVCAESFRRSIASPQCARRQIFTRQQRETFLPSYHSQITLNDLEALFSVLLHDEVDQHEDEKARSVEPDKANDLKTRVHFTTQPEAAPKTATQANCSTYMPQRSRHLNPTPSTTPAANASRVPLTRQSEIPRSRVIRDRAARTIQRRWRSHSADAAARNDAIATIATLRARFQFLMDTFSFPEHLEFREQQSADQVPPTLLFTSANAGVHAHTHELTKLLTLADGVSSYGSSDVREERRSFVRLVEEALDSVDRRVANVWDKKNERSTVTPPDMDVTETSFSTVPAHVVQPESDTADHSLEPNRSMQGGDRPATHLDSDVPVDASTIIPSQTAADTELPTRDNDRTPDSSSRNLASQDVSSDRLPAFVDELSTQGDIVVVHDDAVQEDQGETVQVQLQVADTAKATTTDSSADAALPSHTVGPSHSEALSQRPPSLEPSQTLNSTVADKELNGNVDDTLVSREENATSKSEGPAPDVTSPSEVFDVVYPDSPITLVALVEGPPTRQDPVSHNLVPEKIGVAVPETGDEAQNNMKQDVEEEDEYQLL